MKAKNRVVSGLAVTMLLLGHCHGFVSRHQDRLPGRRGLSRFFVAATKTQHENDATHGKMNRAEVIDSFLSKLQQAVNQRQLVSLVLQGPGKKKKKKDSADGEVLRGCIRQVQGRLIQLKNDKMVLQMTFKYHGATDIAKNWPLESSSDEICEAVKSILDPHNASGELDDNMVPVSEWGNQQEALADPKLALQYGIQSATLATPNQRWEVDQLGSHKPKWKQAQLQQKETEISMANTPTIAAHDRAKQVPLETTEGFLQALGVTDCKGKPKRAMASKLRQCQKFVEIVRQLVARCTAADDQRDISVLDMGCGRGYLTFSLHSFLSKEYPNRTVRSVGIDMRPKLVEEINGIAQSLGPGFADTLSFQEGSIESSMTRQVSTKDDDKSLEILIALHACDTATDDALWYGIARQADILVVAPCCHKQVRPQLNTHMNKAHRNDHPLTDILCHNVYRERHAEMVTDSMRAMLVELAGYHPPTVFEFIGGEHTAKNVMITAVRRTTKRSAAEEEILLQRLKALAALQGIKIQKLAQLMSVNLSEEEAPVKKSGEASHMASKRRKLSAGSMPRLQ